MGSNQSSTNIPKTSYVTPVDGVYTKVVSNAKNYTNVRALVTGINYDETDVKLNGARNDANDFANFLRQRYPSNLTLVQLDDSQNPEGLYYPTRENMAKAFRFLCSSSTLNDYNNNNYTPLNNTSTLLIFYFSGHGDQKRDISGDEADYKDEVLCLVDKSGQIDRFLDDDICRQYGRLLPSNTNLVTVFDCCHSGTMLDLKYTLNGSSFVSNRNTETPCQIYYIGGTIDSLCTYEKNGRGYFTQTLLNILNRHRDLTIYTLSLILRKELSLVVLPSKQTITISTGKSTSPHQLFPI